MKEVVVGGYDLSGGASNWTSSDLSGYSFFSIKLIGSNITGETTIKIQEGKTTFKTLETKTLSEGVTEVFLTLTEKYIKLDISGTATGKFSGTLVAEKNNLQTQEDLLKRYTYLNA